MKFLLILSLFVLFFFIPQTSYEHQDGCHRWHSCPSDSGSYTCGDTGKCSECTNNQYCQDRMPRTEPTPEPKTTPELVDDYHVEKSEITTEIENNTTFGFILYMTFVIIAIIIAFTISYKIKKWRS